MTTESSPASKEEVLGVPAKDRYGLVGFLLFAGYLLSGLEMGTWVWLLYGFLWIFVLGLALWTPELPRRLRYGGLAATALVLIAMTFDVVAAEFNRGWGFFLLAIAQGAAFLAVLLRISKHPRVTMQTVLGGVSAYALIGFTMAAIFNGLELLLDGPFLVGVTAPGDYTYFSFVTLTTVGFGDITAASQLAKRLVVAEAFVGQVFVVTLIARLVSLLGQSRR